MSFLIFAIILCVIVYFIADNAPTDIELWGKDVDDEDEWTWQELLYEDDEDE